MAQITESLVLEFESNLDAGRHISIGHDGVYASTHFKEQSEVWKRKSWRVEEFIVKPGENK